MITVEKLHAAMITIAQFHMQNAGFNPAGAVTVHQCGVQSTGESIMIYAVNGQLPLAAFESAAQTLSNLPGSKKELFAPADGVPPVPAPAAVADVTELERMYNLGDEANRANGRTKAKPRSMSKGDRNAHS